jgi:hypothetical protein
LVETISSTQGTTPLVEDDEEDVVDEEDALADSFRCDSRSELRAPQPIKQSALTSVQVPKHCITSDPPPIR